MDFHELMINAPKDGQDGVLKLYYLDLLVKSHKREEHLQECLQVFLKMILDIGYLPLPDEAKKVICAAVDKVTEYKIKFESNK